MVSIEHLRASNFFQDLKDEYLAKLVKICHEDAVGRFLERNDLPEQVTRVLVEKAKKWQYRKLEPLAKNPNTSEEIMVLIAEKKDYKLQSILLKNSNITARVLDILSKTRNPEIRETVAKNVLTPKASLKRLSASKNTSISESAKKTLKQL